MLDVLPQVFQHLGASINSWDAITCKYHMVTYEGTFHLQKRRFVCFLSLHGTNYSRNTRFRASDDDGGDIKKRNSKSENKIEQVNWI